MVGGMSLILAISLHHKRIAYKTFFYQNIVRADRSDDKNTCDKFIEDSINYL